MTDLTREAVTMQRMAITGWGHCTPEGVVTNDDLATVMETSDEWIATRSGRPSPPGIRWHRVPPGRHHEKQIPEREPMTDLYRFLDRHRIAYQRHDHPAVYTVADVVSAGDQAC